MNLTKDEIALKCAEYLGQIVIENIDAAVYRPSNEKKYPGSFIVLEKDAVGVHTLYRYFIDSDGKISQEIV